MIRFVYYLAAADAKLKAENIPKIDPGKLISNVLNVFYFFSGVIAVIVIILSALTFVISRGDPGSIKKAKDMLLYAVAGLIVVLGAYAITKFVTGSF